LEYLKEKCVSSRIVAIVGRPNVGKSTLFNRIVGRRVAIVDETAGVTRDRHYASAEWLGQPFCLIDTGGIVNGDVSELEEAIRVQTHYAVGEAALILFVVDAREGMTAADQDIAIHLRKSGKPIFLVANKVEAGLARVIDPAFYALGFREPFFISAEHGYGVGDLMDAVLVELPEQSHTPAEITSVHVAVVGRPNVGKSSLINRILGENRLLVTDAPGTTRDAIDSQVTVNRKLYTLIDTAGMRKPRRIGEILERTTVGVSLQRIKRCDVAVLVLDPLVGIGEQDIRIATYIERQGKACIIAINKWDAVTKDSKTYDVLLRLIREMMPFLAHAPIISLSALTGTRVTKLFPLIDRVYEESRRRVSVPQLHDFVKAVTRQRPAPLYRGKPVNFSFLVQTLILPPTFLFFVNRPEGVIQQYQRYLEHRLREHFGFAGAPIRLHFRKKVRTQQRVSRRVSAKS
jgi:GTP-binding protein